MVFELSLKFIKYLTHFNNVWNKFKITIAKGPDPAFLRNKFGMKKIQNY